MDEQEFTEAEANLLDLCNEYEQCECGVVFCMKLRRWGSGRDTRDLMPWGLGRLCVSMGQSRGGSRFSVYVFATVL